MHKILFIILIIIFSVNGFAAAAEEVSDLYDIQRTQHKFEGTGVYDGDAYYAFRGDPLALLSDGSIWKVHSKDSGKFKSWQAGETVHVEVRKGFHLLRREHSFLLSNHHRNESVRVMLVEYPTTVLIIVDVKPMNTPINKLAKEIHLSDGSVWVISGKHADRFRIWNPIYIGYNTLEDGKHFFFITGIDRHAVDINAEPPRNDLVGS